MDNVENELTARLYRLLADLPRHCGWFPNEAIPKSGIYFYFERGEHCESAGLEYERIVRIGTHLVDGNLPGRLRSHYRGNWRSSVFRRHVRAALKLTPSGPGQIPPEQATYAKSDEIEISNVMLENFWFCCVPVSTKEERLTLERGLIGLLARYPVGIPSEGWLGRNSIHPEIRESGLWNRNHVAAPPLNQEQISRLQTLVEIALASPPVRLSSK